jgi:hypothetical protein
MGMIFALCAHIGKAYIAKNIKGALWTFAKRFLINYPLTIISLGQPSPKGQFQSLGLRIFINSVLSQEEISQENGHPCVRLVDTLHLT